jgi:hypothetical protein
LLLIVFLLAFVLPPALMIIGAGNTGSQLTAREIHCSQQISQFRTNLRTIQQRRPPS